MSRPPLEIPHFFRTTSPKREIGLRLHNHIYVFTSSVGTQTDPEIFFVNGKPARAVKPFRVVLPPEKPEQPPPPPPPPPAQETLSEVQELEGEQLEPQELVTQGPESPQAEAQEPESEQPEEQQDQDLQQLNTQQQNMQDNEANLQDIAQALEPQVEWPLASMQPLQEQDVWRQTQWAEMNSLQSQETQTELLDLQRQLLMMTRDEAETSATDSSESESGSESE